MIVPQDIWFKLKILLRILKTFPGGYGITGYQSFGESKEIRMGKKNCEHEVC